MTPDQLGDLAEEMVPIAQQLIGAVHDDGPSAVARVFAIVPEAHMPALAVVLAAMCDPTRTAGDMLAWVNWDGPQHRDPTLFDGNPDPEDARTWSDAECHRLWRQHRSAKRERLSDLERIRLLRGYREWERRRGLHKRRTGQPLGTGL